MSSQTSQKGSLNVEKLPNQLKRRQKRYKIQQNLKRLRRTKTNLRDFVQSSADFVQNLRRFRGEGSFRASREEPF